MNLHHTSPEQPFCRKRRFAIIGVILAVITFAAFLPSLDNGFVNRDDPGYVMDNLDIRSFSGRNLGWIFSSVYINHYIPATMLTYMADYGIFGLDAKGFHFTSLFLHVANVLLVFALFYGLSKNLFLGAVTALLFGIHPLRVEAVAWIAERKEVLSDFFYFASLLFYMAFRRKNARKYYALSLAALLVSLLSKTMSVSQPFVLLLMDYLAGRKIDRRALLEKLPFFVLSAAFAAVAVLTVSEFHDIYSHYSIVQRVLAPAYAIAFYLVKFIAPVNLCASYFPPAVPDAPMTLAMVLAGIAVSGMALAVYMSRCRTRIAVFGSLLFLVTLLPVLQIVNSGGLVMVADRYTYIPLLGMSFMAAWGILPIIRRAGNNAAVKTAVYAALVAAGGVLFCLTWQRCGVWKDSLTLWSDIVAKSRNAAQAYLGRGGAWRDKGAYGAAVADFSRALELDPENGGAYFQRGYVYAAFLGRTDLAVADLDRAITLEPEMPDAWNALGIAEGSAGAYRKAAADFDRALSLKPDFIEAYVNRGIARLQGLNDAGGAVNDFTMAITLDASFAKAYLMRGVARGMMGLYDSAVADFDRAIKLDPGLSAAATQYRAQVLAAKTSAAGSAK